MITNENVLSLKTRGEIYNYILKHPGMHLREISRKKKISYSVLRHHLNFLEKLGLIITKSNQRFIRFYANQKVSKKDKEIINVIREEIPRSIVILLLSPGPIENFTNSLEEEGRKVKNYIKTYSQKEILSLARFWGKEHKELFRVIKHRSTIDFHL
ncbi:MAG TPA: winged helix-turn-helix transcriptional regulator, partial [Candidatus Lokiarchaeia archaeon]